MPEKKQQQTVGAPIWGVFLLFLGVVFLLQTLDILPWGIWETLWRFWPVLIIIIGLGILLRHYNVWLVSLLTLAILGACLGISIWQYGPSPTAGVATKSYSEPLGDIERAQIEVDITAGSLTISSLPPGSPNFVGVDSEARDRSGDTGVDFHQQDGEGRLYLSTKQVNDGIRWEVSLARGMPLTINIKSSASSMELDLVDLKVTELRLDVDVGNYIVMMPSSAGTTDIWIKADVANIEVNIPDGVAARIRADTDLSAFDVDEARFPRQGDYYISHHFDATPNQIYLEIDCDLGRIQVR